MSGLLIMASAVAVHHTETVAGAWDGGEMERRVRSGESAAYYRQIYAWQRPGADPATKGGWGFPHHQVAANGDPGPANLTGCSTGIGRVNQGNGGADRRGIYDHLAAHLRDGDKEPPTFQAEATVDVLAHLFAQRRRAWYRMQTTGDVADVWIYDEISPFGITAAQFVADLQAIEAPSMLVHINSPGGDVFDAVAIYNALRSHSATVETQVDGIAASAASIIAMAGSPTTMQPHATMMIHDAMGLSVGNAATMRTMADTLDGVSETIAGIYAEKAGGTVSGWRERMVAETWYSDQGAVDAGLADSVRRVRAGTPYAERAFDLSTYGYRNVPTNLLGAGARDARGPTKRDIEHALRDVGMSQSEARRFIATGWPDLTREADGEGLLATLQRLHL